MWTNRNARVLALLVLSIAAASLRSQTPNPSPHVFFRVQAASSIPAPVSGRLLIFVKKGSGDQEVDNDAFHPDATWVAAREVQDLAPGASIVVDGDETAYPEPFSAMTPGDYEAQAELDTSHRYNYGGRYPEDWMSGVIPLTHWTPASGRAAGIGARPASPSEPPGRRPER